MSVAQEVGVINIQSSEIELTPSNPVPVRWESELIWSGQDRQGPVEQLVDEEVYMVHENRALGVKKC